jgi:hypothetical protein
LLALKTGIDYNKNNKEWQLWNHNAKKYILGVDGSVKTMVQKEIRRGTPTSSLFHREDISEPTFAGENQSQDYVGRQSGPYVSMASNTSLSAQSWAGQNVDDIMADLVAPHSIGEERNPYIHDSPRNMKQINHGPIELDNDLTVLLVLVLAMARVVRMPPKWHGIRTSKPMSKRPWWTRKLRIMQFRKCKTEAQVKAFLKNQAQSIKQTSA